MTDIYTEQLVGAPDICSNCLRIRLVERTEVRSRGMTAAPRVESTFTRCEKTTELDHHPADEPTQDKHLFCECGVADARTRMWDDTDISRDRFKTLLKHTIRAAEHKGVTLDRETAVKHALANWDGDVDGTLAAALEHGSTAATVSSDAATAD